MPALAPELARSEATVPLSSFIQPYCAHYFSGRSERPHYRQRDHGFPGLPHLMPPGPCLPGHLCGRLLPRVPLPVHPPGLGSGR